MKIGIICAFRSDDKNWYRGEIQSIDGDHCKLKNLEYGNVEIIHKSNLRFLEERFAKFGKLIEKAYFNIKPSVECDEARVLKTILSYSKEGSKELNFKIIKPFRDGFIIDPIDPDRNTNIFDQFVSKKKIAVRINDEELSEILDKLNDVKEEANNTNDTKEDNDKTKEINDDTKKAIETPPIIIEEVEIEKLIPPPPPEEVKKNSQPGYSNAKISALTTPNDFYLVRTDTLENFNKFHNDIQILAPAMQPLIDFECGIYCLAHQPYDSQWYRAKIIDSDEQDQSIITVVCIDNGKTFSIENKVDLKTMQEQLKDKPCFGIPCSLPIKIERKCEDEVTELMLKMVEKDVEFKTIIENPQLNFIELIYDNENVVDLLVRKKYAQRIETFSSGNGYTSHINSLSDFFVQLEEDQLKLELISSIIDSTNGKFEKVKNPKVGQIVAAKFPDDNFWYRSRIQSIDKNEFTVEFVDYGNACLVTEIGEIDASISELPAMSKHCTLAKPKNLLSFSEEAEKKFLEITANGATILYIKNVKPGDIVEVELFCNGQNIFEQISPLCKLESDTTKEY